MDNPRLVIVPGISVFKVQKMHSNTSSLRKGDSDQKSSISFVQTDYFVPDVDAGTGWLAPSKNDAPSDAVSE